MTDTPETPQATGLASLTAEVKDVEAKLEHLAEEAAAPAPTVNIPDPPTTVAPTTVVSDEPIPVPQAAPPPPPKPAQDHPTLSAEEKRLAALEAEKQAFYDRVRAARDANTPPEPKPQPVPERIRLQTEQEMEAGRAAIEKHAAARAALQPQPAPSPTEGTMTPVHRPNDYVPDQRKGQGNIVGTVLQ